MRVAAGPGKRESLWDVAVSVVTFGGSLFRSAGERRCLGPSLRTHPVARPGQAPKPPSTCQQTRPPHFPFLHLALLLCSTTPSRHFDFSPQGLTRPQRRTNRKGHARFRIRDPISLRAFSPRRLSTIEHRNCPPIRPTELQPTRSTDPGTGPQLAASRSGASSSSNPSRFWTITKPR